MPNTNMRVDNIGLISANQNPSSVAGGLVAYWSVNEGSGSIARDFSGNKHETLLSNITWTIGNTGNGIVCNGSTSVGATNYIFPSTNFSYGCWVKTTSSGTSYQYRPCGNSDNGAGLSGTGIIYASAAANNVYVVFRVGSNEGSHDLSYNVPAANTSDGNWHHVFVTVSSTAGLTLYYDGVFAASNGASTTLTNNYTFNIGRDANSPAASFNGSIDDVRIYNRVLSADEVRILYNSSFNGFHKTVVDWRRRVVVNGGAPPSNNTMNILSNFMYALDFNNLTPKMKAVNCFVPDSLIASITPLIKVIGNDPWTNTNFSAGDLNINGLSGNGSNKFLSTGIIAYQLTSSALPVADSHIALYISTGSIEAKNEWGGTDSPGSTLSFRLYGHYNAPNVTATQNYGDNTGIQFTQSSSIVPYTGYVCANRVSGNRDIYVASSTLPHMSGINSTTLSSTIPTSTTITVFATNEAGSVTNYSSKRYSFMSMGNGLTTNESITLFNLVQALRTSLGGGYV